MDMIYNICLILTLVGAINWGLVSLLKFDLVAALFAGGGEFGNISGLSRVVLWFGWIIRNICSCCTLFIIVSYLKVYMIINYNY